MCLTATELKGFWIGIAWASITQKDWQCLLQQQQDGNRIATTTNNEANCWLSEQARKTIPLTHCPRWMSPVATVAAATTTTSSSSALEHQHTGLSVWPVDDDCQILWTTDGITTLQDDDAAVTGTTTDGTTNYSSSSSSNLIRIQLTTAAAKDGGGGATTRMAHCWRRHNNNNCRRY